MANPEHLAILKQGLGAWNEWRKKGENQILSPDLSGINFSGADLTKLDLHMVNFAGANLQGANLSDTNLLWANLSQTNMNGANLMNARLYEANLIATDLSEAHISRANLNGANLTGAHLLKADLSGAVLIGADLSLADFIKADLTGANLSRANLLNARLVDTNLSGANLTYCRVYGIAAWDLKLAGATQSDLIITFPEEPTITVDNLEVAQFIYLLLNNEKIRDVINTISTKLVLILGRFTPERKAILEVIRYELRKRDYLPVLFDFDKPAARSLTETVITLAHLSRFIIADLTDPSSIPQELYAIIPPLAVPVQPVLEYSKREYSLFPDLTRTYHWVLPIHHYKDTTDLLASLSDKVITPAEQKAKELEKR